MTTFDASPEVVNLELTEADDEEFTITYNDSDGNTQDISGWTFWMTVKRDRQDDDADAVFQKTVTTHTDAANGKTTIPIAASDTQGEGGNTLWYDQQRKDSNGDVKTYMTGTLYVERETTEAT